MSSLNADLAKILAAVSRPGDFFVSGTVELRPPVLEVDGLGRVALPLLPAQAAQLAAVAEPAPYGRGEKTILDQAVRRSWQIGPAHVRLGGRGWAATLEAMLARVADGLGVDAPITAELHKLLLYETGGFFVGHRDTEKARGMFGTLVIVLPSVFAGGGLVVQHKGRKVLLDLRRDDPAELGFAAFYADCVHEVLPVTEGSRLTLVYNLLRPGRGKPPEPPGYEREQARLVDLLQAWRDGRPTPDDATPDDATPDDATPEEGRPEKLVHLLEHAYTPAELGFAALKGVDAAVAGVLAAAAAQAGCDLHLALLTIEESGSAEYSGDYRGRGRWDDEDEDDFEVGELCDRRVVLSEWRRRDGEALIPGELPAEDDEFTPPGVLEELEPDEEHFHEATGNEGASFERTYRRATLVLWPSDRRFAVLSQGGLPVTLPYLEALADRWAGSAPKQRAGLAAEAHDLAGHMIARWPGGTRSYDSDKTPSDAARMLGLLIRLGDGAAIERFLLEVAAAGRTGTADAGAIVAALACLPPARASELVARIVTGTAATAPAACAALLARAAAAWPKQRRASLAGAAARLVAALPGKPVRNPDYPTWPPRVPTVEPAFVVALLHGLDAIDAALAGRAVEHILAWPVPYGLDDVLVPALRLLAKGSLATPARARLRDAGLAHLRARIALPLAPPADWQRDSALPCHCASCTELARFLDHPAQQSWVFKAAEGARRHVEETIRKAHSDVDTTTDRRGRPYSLVCTKNQASYQRRARQRAQDLKDVAVLGG